jgi:hypothetical protein
VGKNNLAEGKVEIFFSLKSLSYSVPEDVKNILPANTKI